MKLTNGIIFFESGENPFKLFNYPLLSKEALSPYGYKLVATKDKNDLAWAEATEKDCREMVSAYYNITVDNVHPFLGCYLDSNTGKCVVNATCMYGECLGPMMTSAGYLGCLCGGYIGKK